MSGKMTLTINPDLYGTLLAKYQPKVIETDEENENAIFLAEELSHKDELTPEETTLLQLLVTLIEKYEEDNHPINDSNPQDMLLHFREAQNINEADLIKMFGSPDIVHQIMDARQQITYEQAMMLGNLFSVNPKLFLTHSFSRQKS